ncbi:CBS domain-containing protein [Cohnella pontilimi]|uniref:CBS domain-containing protein n=1 Tax=Cohnella pontilimi TaxID=2564100 RepID=A0A4U0FIK2_9BACL|nr:CBS domain-containing protein [Cohnella pontilimi]TJY43272.1 CBS domain-containing protein [Cohnella pontilimi]
MRNIAETMTKECITISPMDSLADAAVLMREHDTGFLPVVEGNKLVGVVTDRDMVTRGLAKQLQGSASVKEVMSDDLTTVKPNASVDEAVSLMASRQIRRLPVVENGELKGIIALGDLAVQQVFVSEAGDALSGISEHEHRESTYH